jgi:hypothetical protein
MTREINCRLPAKDFFYAQCNPDESLSSTDLQSSTFNLPVIKGTPRYLIDNLPI